MDGITRFVTIISENHLAAVLSAIVLIQAMTLILLFVRTRRPRRRGDRASQLPSGMLEQWHQLSKDIEGWEGRLDELGAETELLREKLSHTVSRTAVIRYNALPGTGGEQSFSAAFLDDNGDGVVVSALHGRMECWVYGKAISRGAGLQRLSPEEERAVAEALARGEGDFHRRKGE